ncbi:hypothetical protein, partial [Salmonella enterica]
LITALLVLVLGVWPQPLISLVQLAMPLMKCRVDDVNNRRFIGG